MLIVCTMAMMLWEWLFTSGDFLPRTHSLSLIMRRISASSNWETFYKIPNQCSWEESRSLETREVWKIAISKRTLIEMWQLNVIWYPRWNPGKEKGHRLKKNLQLIIMYHYWFIIVSNMPSQCKILITRKTECGVYCLWNFYTNLKVF